MQNALHSRLDFVQIVKVNVALYLELGLYQWKAHFLSQIAETLSLYYVSNSTSRSLLEE